MNLLSLSIVNALIIGSSITTNTLHVQKVGVLVALNVLLIGGTVMWRKLSSAEVEQKGPSRRERRSAMFRK